MTFSIAPSIETQKSFFEWEIKMFPIRKIGFNVLGWLVRKYVDKLNELLDEAYTDLQGALFVLKGYSTIEAKRDLPKVKSALKILIVYKSYLERANYLDSDEVRSKIGLVVSTLYDIEIQLKKKSFDGQSRVPENPELISALAAHSQNAITNSLTN